MIPPSVQRIDKFDVLRRLGRGGMGSVYLARDPDIERLVAIKLLNEGFDEEDLRGRFSAEARSASALRHPNVVTIFQTGTFLGRPFIVMEYIAGETFADIIASRRPVPIGEKLGWLDQLLAGLHYAHTKGVVHRDIKPSNVMVDPEGSIRILDFGIARLGDGGLTQTGTLLGTLNYIAPEQLAGKTVDARADIFAAGLVAYELLASQRAFPQEFPEIVTQIGFHDPPPLEEACPGIDPRLVAIIGRCLAKQADDRYADCAAVRRVLDAVRKSPSVPEAARTAVPPIAPAPSPPASMPAEFPPTMAIPRRPSAPSPETTPEVVRRPNVRASGRRVAVAGAVLALAALAVVAWRVTMSFVGQPDEPARVATDAREPLPPPAVAAPDRVGPGPAGTSTETSSANQVAGQAQPANPVRPTVEADRPSRAATRAPEPAPVRVGGAVPAPKLIKRVSPVYPSPALSAGVQGIVILETTIGPDGKVRDVRAIRPIPLLDAAAIEAVRQWEYAPTIIKGIAVPVITTVAVEFKLTPPKPIQVGGAVKRPTQIKRVDPAYPAEAQAAGVQGVIIMEATIGADGKVTDVRVLKSIPLLDKSATDAVRQWEYTPTLLNDVAVPVQMTVTVNFELKAPTAPPAAPPAKPPVK